MQNQQFFATAALGFESLLAAELIQLGAVEAKEERAGVRFFGELRLAYKVCLWSRLASRVLLPLVSFHAPDPDILYAETQKLDWVEHLALDTTFAVDCTTVHSQINHSQYGALRIKDAIVDQFRSRCDDRPSVSV